MSYWSDAGREPLRQQDQRLSHRVSDLSQYSGYDNTRSNPYDSPGPLRGRESLVSLNSRASFGTLNEELHDEGIIDSSPTTSWTGSLGYTGASGAGYAPVGMPVPSRAPSKASYRARIGTSLRRPGPETIDEEEFDLSLMQAAAPMGGHPDMLDEDRIIAPGFDVGSALGPMGAQDEAFMRKLEEEEAKGMLTGGLGLGFRPNTTVSDADLLSSPTVVQRSLSRSFTRRMSSRRLGRVETIRYAGQGEANRRGEVIEVVVEEPEPAGADLSTMEGPMGIASDEARRSTFNLGKTATTQIFYPQPNWKPFSMRWPYLTMLILLSMGLAVMTQVLFRMYTRDNPILRFKSPSEVDEGIYFIVRFGPTIVAVVYGVLWQFTDFEVRRLEAYFQMSKPGGALAAESINVDYVTMFSFFRPFHALKVGHHAVALSSAATTFAVSLVPTFAAAVLTLGKREGVQEIYFSTVSTYLLTGILALNVVGGLGLFYLLQTRRTGLVADVRGIAGLASMAVVSHILMDFKDLDTAKPKDIHHKLKHHRYLLRNSSLTPDDENPASSQDREKYEGTHFSQNPHPAMLRPASSIPFIIALVLFTGFIPAFLFTPAEVVTEKVPWLATAMAVGLKLGWTSLETAVRMMEPYYILSKRHAPSKILTLDYTALPFAYMPLRALFNGHFIMFLLGWGSVMAEFLTILVSGLATVRGREFMPNSGIDPEDMESGQETARSFFVSLATALFILLYMTLVSTMVFVRRRHPFLPRQPSTIASVLAFIHQSKMVYKFVGTSKLTNSQMADRLDDGTTYGLGWFKGRDGQVHCGVDQEELMSAYKHGVDASKGSEPWNMQWDVL